MCIDHNKRGAFVIVVLQLQTPKVNKLICYLTVSTFSQEAHATKLLIEL